MLTDVISHRRAPSSLTRHTPSLAGVMCLVVVFPVAASAQSFGPANLGRTAYGPIPNQSAPFTQPQYAPSQFAQPHSALPQFAQAWAGFARSLPPQPVL